MRKLLALTGALIPAFWLCAQTPITLDENDMPEAGLTFLVTSASPLIAFDGEDTGEDHNWDFSWLVPILDDTVDWVEDNETNPIYFFLWLTSDIAQSGLSIENDFLTIEDVYYFYEKNDERFAYSGFAGTIADIPLPIWFEENETILELPATYGQATSSSVGFDIDIPDIGGWSESRIRENVIDGWGTLSTPADNYDVLRMRSVIEVTDTFSYDGTVLPVTYTTIEYRWIAKEEGMPVLQINAQEIFGVETITSVTYKTAELTAIQNNDVASALPMQIPQPVHTQLQAQMLFAESGNCAFTLSDIAGRWIIGAEIFVPQGAFTWTYDVQNLLPGMYVLSVTQNGKYLGADTFIKD